MEKCGPITSSAHRRPGTIAALEQLEEALHALPAERKRAYLEAIRRAPRLVQIESPPLRFLRFSRFCVREAADRLAFYWESRLKIFGDDRAFRPLTQSGQGALDETDVVFLKSGYFLFLPDDDDGRTVLYTDLSKLCGASPETCLRVAFYAWSVVSENERSQDDGHVAVVGLFGSKLDLRFKRCEELVSVALPVRVKDTYLLCCAEKTDSAEMTAEMTDSAEMTDNVDFFMSAMPSAVEAMETLTGKREIIYLTNTKAQLSDKMESSNFSKSALPTTVGGSWGLRNFEEWLRQRRITEMDRYSRDKAPVMKAEAVGEQGGPSTSRKGVVNSSHDSKTQPNNELFNVEKKTSSVVSCTAALSDKHHTQENSRDRDTNADSEEHPHDDVKLRQELEEAIGRIPMNEKQGYCEAVERAPHLVRNDPDPVTFLQCENNDIGAAASRVVRFWNLRKELFADRAFFPMDQTGSGALAPKDLEFLRTGVLQMLPPDEEGRNVICCQRCVISADMWAGESKFRCLFYLACVASESETTRQHGHILLRCGDADSFVVNCGNAFQFCGDTFPSRPAFTHSLVSHDVAAKKLVHDTIVPTMLKNYGEYANRSRFVHTGVSGREIADKMKRHGIKDGGLPASVGGTWTVNDFRLWQKTRVTLEKQRAAAMFSANALKPSCQKHS